MHALAGNAGEIGEPRRPVMLRLLGNQQRDWVVMDAEGHFAREKTFLGTSTLGPSAERRRRR
eukprot:595367-Alexandrium_andersonii.AAC.1